MFPPLTTSTSTSSEPMASTSTSTSDPLTLTPITPAPLPPALTTREARSTTSGKVLDDVARERRQKRMLESLEMDNYQEEPHADLVMSKKAPKFAETIMETSPATTPKEKGTPRATRNKKNRPAEYFKKYRTTFAQLLEEDKLIRGNEFNYARAEAGPSKYPPRKFCNVCGLPSAYTCGQCGIRYCTVKCFKTHQETRCLKWTA